jgi:hypothetical protein
VVGSKFGGILTLQRRRQRANDYVVYLGELRLISYCGLQILRNIQENWNKERQRYKKKSFRNGKRNNYGNNKNARFKKNGYSQDWHEEAAKIGLPNAKNTVFPTKVFSKYNNINRKRIKIKNRDKT